MTEGKRISMNMSPATVIRVDAYMDIYGGTMTDAIARLVGFGDLLIRAEREGKQVLLRDANGEIEQLRII